MASRYKNIPIIKDDSGTRYYQNVIYPNIPLSEDDIYLIATAGDRYDKLAQVYYSDSRLWWVIASANNFDTASLIPTPGQQLRIPADRFKALELFEQVNRR